MPDINNVLPKKFSLDVFKNTFFFFQKSNNQCMIVILPLLSEIVTVKKNVNKLSDVYKVKPMFDKVEWTILTKKEIQK